MSKQSFVCFLICIMLLFSLSCDKITTMFKVKEVKAAKTATAVCIGDSVMLHSDITMVGDSITTLALGETVTWTGDTAMVLENTIKLIQIKLADSITIGWVDEKSVVRGAITGAAMKQTKLYNRPDTLTITENMLDFMDMVAITTVSGDWYQVIGENRRTGGWVRKADIITEKQEVVSAIFARIKLREKNELNRIQKLDYIILNAPFVSSYFIEEIRKLRALEAIFNMPEEVLIEEYSTDF